MGTGKFRDIDRFRYLVLFAGAIGEFDLFDRIQLCHSKFTSIVKNPEHTVAYQTKGPGPKEPRPFNLNSRCENDASRRRRTEGRIPAQFASRLFH